MLLKNKDYKTTIKYNKLLKRMSNKHKDFKKLMIGGGGQSARTKVDNITNQVENITTKIKSINTRVGHITANVDYLKNQMGSRVISNESRARSNDSDSDSYSDSESGNKYKNAYSQPNNQLQPEPNFSNNNELLEKFKNIINLYGRNVYEYKKRFTTLRYNGLKDQLEATFYRKTIKIKKISKILIYLFFFRMS